jgi:hypothetical protein
MKKAAVWTLVLALGLLSLGACQKGGGPGAAKVQDILNLMPKDVAGVVFIDINKAMAIEFVAKALAEPKNAEGLQEFITKTGLDPRKDISYLALGMTGKLTGGEGSSPSGFGILNLKYDKAALLAKMKENQAKFIEGEYEGIATIEIIEKAEEVKPEEPAVGEDKPAEQTPPVEGTDVAPEAEPQMELSVPETPEKPMMGAFLDASNIAIGPVDDVKAVCDVVKKKAGSAKDNPELAALLKTAKKTAMIWGVIPFKPEDVKKMVESTPMLSSLSSLKAMVMHMDYANKTLDLAFKAVTADAGKNKELADMLTGFKSMGALAAGEKPEIGELLGKIEISSGADNVTIKALLPEELLVKLSKVVESEVKDKIGGGLKIDETPTTETPAPATEEIKQ